MTSEFDTAFNSFMSTAFESACDSSTQAAQGGSGYSVELFDDGTFRVLWDNSIGNLYDSPGWIIGIPALGDDEWDDDKDLRFYGNAIDAMMEKYFQLVEDAHYAEAV